MTPAEQAAKWCDNHNENFREVLAAYLSFGYVWSSPRSFILARPVWREWWDDGEKLADHSLTAPDGNCWFIWLAAGDMAEFFKICPQPKDFVCFSRGDVARCWEFERLRRLCTLTKPHKFNLVPWSGLSREGHQ
jgi:hypothetical protein